MFIDVDSSLLNIYSRDKGVQEVDHTLEFFCQQSAFGDLFVARNEKVFMLFSTKHPYSLQWEDAFDLCSYFDEDTYEGCPHCYFQLGVNGLTINNLCAHTEDDPALIDDEIPNPGLYIVPFPYVVEAPKAYLDLRLTNCVHFRLGCVNNSRYIVVRSPWADDYKIVFIDIEKLVSDEAIL